MEKGCYNCNYCEYDYANDFDNGIFYCNNKLSGKSVVDEDEICLYYKEIEQIKPIPMHKKKRFILNDNFDIEKLENYGFKSGGWLIKTNLPKYYINGVLLNDIEIHLEIVLKDNKLLFDDQNNVLVIDDNFGQPYTPFYESMYGFVFLNEVIDKYNEFMNNLVNKGILKEINNNINRKLTK